LAHYEVALKLGFDYDAPLIIQLSVGITSVTVVLTEAVRSKGRKGYELIKLSRDSIKSATNHDGSLLVFVRVLAPPSLCTCTQLSSACISSMGVLDAVWEDVEWILNTEIVPLATLTLHSRIWSPRKSIALLPSGKPCTVFLVLVHRGDVARLGFWIAQVDMLRREAEKEVTLELRALGASRRFNPSLEVLASCKGHSESLALELPMQHAASVKSMAMSLRVLQVVSSA